MSNSQIRIVAFLFLLGIFSACNNRFSRQTYIEYITPSKFTCSDSLRYKTILQDVSSNDVVWVESNRSIILISDSVLNYSIRFGGLGASTSIKYTIVDCLMVVDSVDIYGRKHFQEFAADIFKHTFLYSKDSILNLNNDNKYFSERYIRRLK